MQRACRVPLGSGWSADDPDPGARAGKPTPAMAAICATNSAARRWGGGPALLPQNPLGQASLLTKAPFPSGAFVWAVQPSPQPPGNAAGLLALAGSSGPAEHPQLEDKQLTHPQQVAFSPRVPPPGLWVWLYYKDWLPFTFYGALAVLALADIIACCRARIWVWLHRQV
jgi:hypothetical protein